MMNVSQNSDEIGRANELARWLGTSRSRAVAIAVLHTLNTLRRDQPLWLERSDEEEREQ